MKRTSLCFVLLAFAWPLVLLAQPVPDSQLHPDTIQKLFLQQPRRALQLLDTAEARHAPALPQFRIDMLRGACYEVTAEHSLKERYVRRALASDSVRLVPRRQLRMLSLLANVLRRQGKYEESLQVAGQALDLARNLGNRSLEGELLFNIGHIYMGMKRTDEAFRVYGQGIGVMKNGKSALDLARLSTCYGDLMTRLMGVGREREAIDVGRERERLIRRMSDIPGPPPGYIDQQYGFLYSKMAYLLQLTGQDREAAQYYRRFMQTDFSHQPSQQSEIVPYLLEAGCPADALALTVTADSLFRSAYGTDTLNYTYWMLLDRYVQAYRGLRRFDLADAFQSRIIVLQDSLYAREKASRAQELATLFRLNEQELQLAEARRVAQRRNFWLGSSLAVLAVLAALLTIVVRHLQIIRRRNRIAARQIDLLLAQRDELRRSYGLSLALPADASAGLASAPAPDTPPSAGASASQTYACFLQVEHQLLKQQVFLRHSLDLATLAEAASLPPDVLTALLQKYAGTANVADYLQHLRVDYAVRLMKAQPRLSQAEVARQSGFVDTDAFVRAFSQAFGMSPAHYARAHSGA